MMQCHEVDYQILGDDLQMVEVELDPGEAVIAEAGAMNYMEDGITFEAKMGDGSRPDEGLWGKVLSVGKRALAGQSVMMTHFSNEGSTKSRVSFAAPYPGKIIPINLAEIGGELICQKASFLCAALGTQLDIYFQKKIGVGLFGGEGFILQKLTGDGMVFCHAGGTIIRKDLRGEKLRVDTGCIVAFHPRVQYNIEAAGKNLISMLGGGEGVALATLQGEGPVWLQSLPFSRLADTILRNAPSLGGSQTGESSVLGGIGRKLMGS